VKKTRQNKNLEPRSDSIGTEKAPTAMVWVRRLRETGSVAPARLGRSQAFSAQRGALLLERTNANDTALRRLGMGVSPEFSVRDGLHSVFQRKPAPDLNRIDTGSREANALNKESEPPLDSIETEKAPGRLSRGLELRGWRQAELKKTVVASERDRADVAHRSAQLARVPRPLRACRAVDLHRDLDIAASRHRDLDRRS
jgi:hypothetical protein